MSDATIEPAAPGGDEQTEQKGSAMSRRKLLHQAAVASAGIAGLVAPSAGRVEADDDEPRSFGEQCKQALGEWLYPNVEYGGGAIANDLRFVHAQGTTADTVSQVREYYWKKIFPRKPMMDGSLYRMEGKKPWFIIRSPQGKDGNHTMIVHVTDERTVSIVAAPTGEDGRLDILITLEAHSSRKPVRRG